MTPNERREELLQGFDPVCNTIINYLFSQGWAGDRILRNIATKTYLPHSATIRVVDDREYPQYWVTCEYTSMGQNVASGCILVIQADESQADIEAKMARFVEDAEKCINNSFAVQFIGAGS